MTTPSRHSNAAADSAAILEQLTRLELEVASLQHRVRWTRTDRERAMPRDLTTGLPNRRALEALLLSSLAPSGRPRSGHWALLLTMPPVDAPPTPDRHRWFRAAGAELTDLAGEGGMVGRWSTDEILALVPAGAHELQRQLLERARSLRRRTADALRIEVRLGAIDGSLAHEPGLELCSVLARDPD